MPLRNRFPMWCVPLLGCAVVAIGLAATAGGSAALIEPGWSFIPLPDTASYFHRYIPESLDQATPAAAVVFLHGSGAIPHQYKDFVSGAAELAHCILIMPKSIEYEGWGHPDDIASIADAIALVDEETPLDRHRVAIAGHSSGGAFASWLAYSRRMGFSAVFSLSAPFVGVSEVEDPEYTAPVRMYYGTLDPNYLTGALDRYRTQWQRLTVPLTEDVVTGFGHNTWPDRVMEDGLLFLVDAVNPRLPPIHPEDPVEVAEDAPNPVRAMN